MVTAPSVPGPIISSPGICEVVGLHYRAFTDKRSALAKVCGYSYRSAWKFYFIVDESFQMYIRFLKFELFTATPFQSHAPPFPPPKMIFVFLFYAYVCKCAKMGVLATVLRICGLFGGTSAHLFWPHCGDFVYMHKPTPPWGICNLPDILDGMVRLGIDGAIAYRYVNNGL